MLDIKMIRTETERIKAALARRKENIDIDGLITIDRKRRELLFDVEQKKAQQNAVSKDIPKYKKEGKDTTEIFAQMKELSDSIKTSDDAIRELDEKIQEIMYTIPNIPNDTVPDGDTDEDNVEIRKFMEPTSFDYEPQAHWDLGKNLGILDPEAAAKVTGARFHIYKKAGAKLERAIVNYYLDTHGDNGYEEIFPPFMVHRNSMIGTGQLPKFEEDAFKIQDTEYFLVPTAEVPVTNMLRDDIISGDDLPIKYCSYTACFRAEAGSAGRDTRGLIRQHQFNKVELVQFAKPEDSYNDLEKLVAEAELVLKGLKLPYRVVKICIGDLGFTAAMKYDIEVWMPSYNRYVEISSCSNFEDFQARRTNIKFKNSPKEKAQYVHTLNGSGVAIGRTTAAIIENFQNADGTITIPDVLVPYMGGQTVIKPD